MPRSSATTRLKIQNDGYTLNWSTLGANKNATVTPSAALAALGTSNLNYSAGIWFKESQVRATFGNILFQIRKNTPFRYSFQLRTYNSGKFGVAFYDGTLNPGLSTSNSYPINTWYHFVFTRQGSTIKIYVNGINTNTSTISVGDTTGDTVELGSANAFAGNLSKGFIYDRVLTANEILDIYANNNYPSGALLYAPLNEGTGTTAYDQSGNNLNFTINNGSWSTDTPTGIRSTSTIPRRSVENLVFNGDFEYAPPFTAATTTNNGWINGTASGSAGNAGYGWCFSKDNTASSQFDTTEKKNGNYSLKLSTLDVNSGARANMYRSTSALSAEGYIPALPNTSYTVSGWIKTNLISGSSRGAYIRAQEFSGTSTTALVTNETTYITTNTDWTYYTKTFTTNASTRYIAVGPLIVGTTGTATLIMDAWFDDIRLTKTTPDTRTAA